MFFIDAPQAVENYRDVLRPDPFRVAAEPGAVKPSRKAPRSGAEPRAGPLAEHGERG